MMKVLSCNIKTLNLTYITLLNKVRFNKTNAIKMIEKQKQTTKFKKRKNKQPKSYLKGKLFQNHLASIRKILFLSVLKADF